MSAAVRVTLAVVLACGLGCARADWIDRTLVTVDVTGRWESSGVLLDLEQQGPQVTGSLRRVSGITFCGNTNNPGGPVEGTVAGDLVTLRLTNTTLTALMTVDGDELRGDFTAAGCPRQIRTFRRVGATR
ncbi:MAG TPA: hypothetical protein VIG37_27060 [Methylomirabilota bacterium]|jgi:hypothetical protein